MLIHPAKVISEDLVEDEVAARESRAELDLQTLTITKKEIGEECFGRVFRSHRRIMHRDTHVMEAFRLVSRLGHTEEWGTARTGLWARQACESC